MNNDPNDHPIDEETTETSLHAEMQDIELEAPQEFDDRLSWQLDKQSDVEPPPFQGEWDEPHETFETAEGEED